MTRLAKHSAFSRQHSVISEKFTSVVCCLLLILLLGCGSSTDSSSQKLGDVPTAWAKYFVTGTISASLDVYSSSGSLQTHQDLTIDLNAGTVSAPEFKLPIGDTYRFVLTFNYSLSSTDTIPYAYADFTWLVDQFSENVTFSENDIRYDFDPLDPSISADLADGKIPNLDLDSDGWSNWEELRDHVNPRDLNSVPIIPSIQVIGQQDGSANTATITVIAKDNAHLENLRLVNPLCGVSVISDTQVANVDGSVTRTLVLKLDLLSVRNNPRFLQALADDGVTPAQNANANLAFNINGGGSQPYFVFTDPEENSEIEGPIPFKGIACSHKDINLNSLKFLNQELGGFSWSGNLNSQTGDYEVESSAVDTTLLPDGLNTLTVEVQDSTAKAGQGSGTFKVVNDNQVKVVSPMGRRWVFGNEQIAVTAKNLSDSNIVVIEGNPNFTLTSSTSGGAVGILHVSNLAEGTVIPLTVKAVKSDGSEITREIDFTVKNKPQVQVFQPKASEVFRGWGTKFTYKILNVDPGQIFLDGTATVSQGDQTCQEDEAAKGITVCTGEYSVKLSNTKNFTLSAIRLPTSDEASCSNCTIQQDSQILSTQSLPNDIPEINVAFGAADDETEKPEKIQVPTNSSVKYYLLSLTNQRDGSVINYPEFSSGDIVSLGELDPRTDYLATLQVLNGPGGNLVGEMYKSVTTGDLGLVGWWRFKEENPGQDVSGRGNHGTISGGQVIRETDDTSLEFNDFGDRFDAPINGFSNKEGTVLFWFKPYFDPVNAIGNGSNADISSLLDIGQWNVNSVRLFYSVDGDYCPNSSYAKSLCVQVHGTSASNDPVASVGDKVVPSQINWNFVAATWSRLDQKITLYDNLSNSTISVPLPFLFSFNSPKISLGYSGVDSSGWPAWAYWYRGLIQDVSGYSRALSESEIKNICNRLNPDECP